MYNDYRSDLLLLRTHGVFAGISSVVLTGASGTPFARIIGHEHKCWFNPDGRPYFGTSMCTVPTAIESGGVLTRNTSDIFIRRSRYEGRTLAVPPIDARGNSCGLSGTAYSDLVHEIGHALGIGGGDNAGWVNPGHPQVPDSVVNYNWLAVPLNPAVTPMVQGDFDRGHSEPDCAPYPFDVMAIYALYQSR